MIDYAYIERRVFYRRVKLAQLELGGWQQEGVRMLHVFV